MSEQYLKNVIEAALLAAGRPLSIEDFASLIEEPERPAKTDIQAALAALEDDAYLAKVVTAVARERQRLSLAGLGLEVFSSAANFVSAKLPILAAGAVEQLRRRRILIRDWRDPEHLHEVRITVGLAEDTDAVITALRDILAAA